MNFRVFLSSTWEDMRDVYRPFVLQNLRAAGTEPIGMEDFGSNSERGDQHSVREVRSANVYVGLIGFRYGSLARGESKSITQLEYEEARRLSPMPVLIYLASERVGEIERVRATFRPETLDTIGAPASAQQQRARLDAFRQTLLAHHTCSFFTSPQDVASMIVRDVRREMAGGKTDGEVRLKRGTEALSRLDFGAAQFELAMATNELREDAWPQLAAQARFYTALAKLNGRRPFVQPLTGWREIDALFAAASRLHDTAGFRLVHALCQLDFSRNGMTQMEQQARAMLSGALARQLTDEDDAHLDIFRRCQPDLARDYNL